MPALPPPLPPPRLWAQLDSTDLENHYNCAKPREPDKTDPKGVGACPAPAQGTMSSSVSAIVKKKSRGRIQKHLSQASLRASNDSSPSPWLPEFSGGTWCSSSGLFSSSLAGLHLLVRTLPWPGLPWVHSPQKSTILHLVTSFHA